MFNLLVGKITDLILKQVENTVNWFINQINNVICSFKLIGAKCPALKEVCITVEYDVYRCRLGPYHAAALEESLGCSYSEETDEAARCYFARQRSICMSGWDGVGDASRASRYKNLFSAPDTTELQKQFSDIVGDSFEYITPAIQSAMANVNRVGATDIFTEQASEICDESLRQSMTLDESEGRSPNIRPNLQTHKSHSCSPVRAPAPAVILACVFTWFESFCGVPPEEEEFSAFVNNFRWELPEVPWSWKYNPPPPPPPGVDTPAAQYTRMDPDGAEMVREKLLECFPKLTYVASMSAGSVAGQDTSEDGLGCVTGVIRARGKPLSARVRQPTRARLWQDGSNI